MHVCILQLAKGLVSWWEPVHGMYVCTYTYTPGFGLLSTLWHENLVTVLLYIFCTWLEYPSYSQPQLRSVSFPPHSLLIF